MVPRYELSLSRLDLRFFRPVGGVLAPGTVKEELEKRDGYVSVYW